MKSIIALALLTSACAAATAPTPQPSAPTVPPILVTAPTVPVTTTALKVVLSVGPIPTKQAQRTSFSATTFSGSPISYLWEYGDGQVATSTDDVTFHAYAVAGNYRAQVTAKDAAGQVSVDWQYVEVDGLPTPAAPSLTLQASCGAILGVPNRCQLSATTESGGFVSPTSFTHIAWDFGDGVTVDSAPFPFVNHTWSAAGPYIVRVTAATMDGRTGSASLIVEVK